MTPSWARRYSKDKVPPVVGVSEQIQNKYMFGEYEEGAAR